MLVRYLEEVGEAAPPASRLTGRLGPRFARPATVRLCPITNQSNRDQLSQIN